MHACLLSSGLMIAVAAPSAARPLHWTTPAADRVVSMRRVPKPPEAKRRDRVQVLQDKRSFQLIQMRQGQRSHGVALWSTGMKGFFDGYVHGVRRSALDGPKVFGISPQLQLWTADRLMLSTGPALYSLAAYYPDTERGWGGTLRAGFELARVGARNKPITLNVELLSAVFSQRMVISHMVLLSYNREKRCTRWPCPRR